LTHDEYVKRAEVFVSPKELVGLVSSRQEVMTKSDLLSKSSHEEKDGWQGAVFSVGYEQILRKPIQVRLSSHEGFPDFQIKVEATTHDFEAVMALDKKLGAEYKSDMSLGPVAAERPGVLPAFDPEPLRKAVMTKLEKHYHGTVHLLVYLNYAGAGGNFNDMCRASREAGNGKFESIWLIARGNTTGQPDKGSYFIACAHPSARLASTSAWVEIKGIKGLKP